MKKRKGGKVCKVSCTLVQHIGRAYQMLALFPLGNDKTKGTDKTPKYLAFRFTILYRRNDSTQNIWFLGISLRDHRSCGPKGGWK